MVYGKLLRLPSWAVSDNHLDRRRLLQLMINAPSNILALTCLMHKLWSLPLKVKSTLLYWQETLSLIIVFCPKLHDLHLCYMNVYFGTLTLRGLTYCISIFSHFSCVSLAWFTASNDSKLLRFVNCRLIVYQLHKFRRFYISRISVDKCK